MIKIKEKRMQSYVLRLHGSIGCGSALERGYGRIRKSNTVRWRYGEMETVSCFELSCRLKKTIYDGTAVLHAAERALR